MIFISFLFTLFMTPLTNAFHERLPTRCSVERKTITSMAPIGSGDPTAKNPEEMLNLKVSIESRGFLSNIVEYGKARMARRAVGILQKMPAYRVYPEEEHYTQAIWACEKSDQFSLAVSVFEEMTSESISPTLSTYEALISVAEKTKHFEEAVHYFQLMQSQGIIGSTEAYNSCLIALDNLGNYSQAFEVLQDMIKNNVARSIVSYTACVRACEKAGQAELALDILAMMKAENMDISTLTYNAVLWACVKGGYWYNAQQIFEEMELRQIPYDATSFNAAIWAAEIAGDARKAVMLLRRMKIDIKVRQTMSFDGAISACNKAGDWSQITELLWWMERDNVEKSPVTYKLAIDCYDRYHHEELIGELYLQALRNGYFSPWVRNSRKMDLRGFTLSMAKVGVKTVFLSILEGKLTPFSLQIIVGDVMPSSNTDSEGVQSSFDVDAFQDFLSTLHIKSTGICIEDHQYTLDLDRTVDQVQAVEMFSLTKESIVSWVQLHLREKDRLSPD